MDFSDAWRAIMNGERMTRSGWNGKDQWVMVVEPSGGQITRPFAALRPAMGELVPWVPSQGDLFATDWEPVGADAPPPVVSEQDSGEPVQGESPVRRRAAKPLGRAWPAN